MAPYDSDEEDRRRERFPRERGQGDRTFGFDRNGGGGGNAPPDPIDRRVPFKRTFGAMRRDDGDPQPKRARNEPSFDGGNAKFLREEPKFRPDGPEPLVPIRQYAVENLLALDASDLQEKYNSYKEDYQKRQIKQFFDAHKGEEWFKLKYHPAEKKAKYTRQKEEIQRRLAAYNRLKEGGHLDDLSLDPKHARKIVRLLNAVIVLLGSGDDEMLSKVLNMAISDSAVADVTLEGIEVLKNDDDKLPQPNLIERYGAIIIRCIPSCMTANEIKEVCERCPGFMRLHLFPAQSETHWTRRAIAGFKQNVDLKDVCLGINNIKVKGGDLVAYVSPEVGERVRVAHPYLNHKETALKCLHYGLKIISVFDKKYGFFEETENEPDLDEIQKELSLGTDFVEQSTNPLIQRHRSLIPGRIKEDDILHRTDKMPGASDIAFERDDRVLGALDEVAFFLRAVYSFDLFDYNFYDEEETMPNNLEIFHIRCQDPKSVDEAEDITSIRRGALRIVEDEMKRQLEPYFTARCVPEARLASFGALDPELAVEALITANTVKLSDDKWLCPLSGKKFKGPEFIRKHITSKHADAVEEAKAESLYFNNYLSDPARPVDTVPDPNEHKNVDPRERRRMAPPRREERSPKKEAFRENNAPFRRSFVGYKDLDAVADTEVANVF